jgi:hypothetical protein
MSEQTGNHEVVVTFTAEILLADARARGHFGIVNLGAGPGYYRESRRACLPVDARLTRPPAPRPRGLAALLVRLR